VAPIGRMATRLKANVEGDDAIVKIC